MFNYRLWYIDRLLHKSGNKGINENIILVRNLTFHKKLRKYFSMDFQSIVRRKISFSIYSLKITILQLHRFSINDQYRRENFNIFLIATFLWTDTVKTIPQHSLWIRYNGLWLLEGNGIIQMVDGKRVCVREKERERRMEMTRESLRDVRLRIIGIKVDARNRWNIRENIGTIFTVKSTWKAPRGPIDQGAQKEREIRDNKSNAKWV